MKLEQTIAEALSLYNNSEHDILDLVLFEEAINHVCRISRILELPDGNALLIGVGGKRSLSRLAAFICSFEVHEIKSQNSMKDFLKDLNILFIKTGINNEASVLLIGESEIGDDQIFVPLNDFLAFGEIKNLFDEEESKNIINKIRKKSVYNPENETARESDEIIWKIFLDKVKASFKIILCVSPSGNKLKTITRKFPSIAYRMRIDWFHDWPLSALGSVANYFIDDISYINGDMKGKICEFMACAHKSVNKIAEEYKKTERFYYYATPKLFVKNIITFKELIKEKSLELNDNIEKFSKGIEKIKSVTEKVEILQSVLKVQDIEISKRSEEADKILKVT